ncbi:MAG: hypothetical protein LBR44_06370 [Clostridiales Family XIII bacterium]|jgi:hypothetical protein|nr:hypothetical protein [Clostridiales Family XIII bacterium]
MKKRRKSNFGVLVALIFILATGIGVGSYFLLVSGMSETSGSTPFIELYATEDYGEETDMMENGAASPQLTDEYVMVIGDSITVGAKKELASRIENLSVDAEVGRGMGTGYGILKRRIDAGMLAEGDIVVISLANNIHNGSLDNAQDVIDDLPEGVRLVFVTGHGLSNMKPLNELIRTFPDDYEFITVADWDEAVTGQSGLLASDGIHVAGNKGNVLYAELVLEAIEEALAKPAKTS